MKIGVAAKDVASLGPVFEGLIAEVHTFIRADLCRSLSARFKSCILYRLHTLTQDRA